MERIQSPAPTRSDTTDPAPTEKAREPRRQLRVRSALRAGADPMAFKIKEYDA